MDQTEDDRKRLIDGHRIRSLRISYLGAIQKYTAEERNIVYGDESCVHSSHNSGKGTDGSTSVHRAPISKGKIFIFVYAG